MDIINHEKEAEKERKEARFMNEIEMEQATGGGADNL